MSTDPVEPCTLWYTGQTVPANGAYNWKTWIHRFSLGSTGACSLS